MLSYSSSFSFREVCERLRDQLIDAPIVEVGEWQSQRTAAGMLSTAELEDVTLEVDLPQSIDDLAEMTLPNLPWAEEHFQERVSGIPYNPPPSHVRWPFAQKHNASHTDDSSKFSHTYPERMWPKYGDPHMFEAARRGVRFEYGDLRDVVTLLTTRRGTRQGYLPIWFPEDTGCVHGERVPCTLGYHLMERDGSLKIVYHMRSCDFLRHFRDDVYMAGRLCQWVAQQVDCRVGRLVMHVSSLHVFAPADLQILRHRRATGRP